MLDENYLYLLDIHYHGSIQGRRYEDLSWVVTVFLRNGREAEQLKCLDMCINRIERYSTLNLNQIIIRSDSKEIQKYKKIIDSKYKCTTTIVHTDVYSIGNLPEISIGEKRGSEKTVDEEHRKLLYNFCENLPSLVIDFDVFIESGADSFFKEKYENGFVGYKSWILFLTTREDAALWPSYINYGHKFIKGKKIGSRNISIPNVFFHYTNGSILKTHPHLYIDESNLFRDKALIDFIQNDDSSFFKDIQYNYNWWKNNVNYDSLKKYLKTNYKEYENIIDIFWEVDVSPVNILMYTNNNEYIYGVLEFFRKYNKTILNFNILNIKENTYWKNIFVPKDVNSTYLINKYAQETGYTVSLFNETNYIKYDVIYLDYRKYTSHSKIIKIINENYKNLKFIIIKSHVRNVNYDIVFANTFSKDFELVLCKKGFKIYVKNKI